MAERWTRADLLLRENIRTLIARRKVDDKDLAMFCGHGSSWISKILSDDDPRGVRVPDLGKIADFFGLTVQDLFSPGISELTERRKRTRRTGLERRHISDRRRAQGNNLVAATAERVTQLGSPPPSYPGGPPDHVVTGDHSARTLGLSRETFREELDRLITDTLQSLAQLQRLRESSDTTAAPPGANGETQRPTLDRGIAKHPPRRQQQRKTGS